MNGTDNISRGAIGLARNIAAHLNQLQVAEFPTETPGALAQVLIGIVSGLRKVVESSADQRLKQYAYESLRVLGTQLQYLENASSHRVPASLISPIESLIGSMVPNARILLCVQWDYNYTVRDIVPLYRLQFGRILGKAELDTILTGIEHFYVVAVPHVEDANVLLHAILGHESGHRIAKEFLKKEDQAALVASVWERVGDLTWADPHIGSLPSAIKLRLRQHVFNQILEARRRALEELISDIVGYRLFGLSAVFASEQIAMADVLDALPDEQSELYPPWRYRLRVLMALVSEDNVLTILAGLPDTTPVGIVKTAGRVRLEQLRAVVESDADFRALEGSDLLKRAYLDILCTLQVAKGFVDTEIVQARLQASAIGVDTPVMIERLAMGIPPDEVERNDSTPDFRSALVAGWLYYLAQITVPYNAHKPWNNEDDEALNRLVLKAIESIELRRHYNVWATGQGVC
jgi:hypothetical protein